MVMKLFRYLLAIVFSTVVIASCSNEEAKESKAILAGDSEITLPATETTKAVTIYADGTWAADVTDTWLSIEPASGQGTVDVVLTVDANLSDAEREAKIIVKGASTLNDVEISVRQKMDRFRDTGAKTVTESLALKEGDLAKLSECQVMALGSKGFVVSDGTNNVFVLGSDPALKVGCKLTLTGDVVAFNNIYAIQLEDVFLTSDSEVVYPEAEDITDVGDYAPGKVVYISATVSFAKGGVLTEGGQKFGTVYNNTDEDDDSFNYHKVTVCGYYLGTSESGHSIMAVTFDDKGMEAIPYLQFEIGTSAFKNANKSYGENHTFKANVGSGFIKYVTNDLEGSDPDGKWKMDISGNDPRCTGPWYGDYWHFVGSSAVKANTEFKIQFGARTSATGPKYWILEYLDGTIWKTVGTCLESTDITKGENVTYTHAMNADGQTNVIVDETFVITKNMEKLQVRFRCVSNWQANGQGVLTKRNGGSARLSINSGASSSAPVTAPQPSILITKMGDGNASEDPEPEYADIELSSPLLTFEGTPESSKVLKVLSDHDFSVKSNVNWLSFSVVEGTAHTPVEIEVTCEPSDLSSLREGKIIVTSADSNVEVYVVQSAAGGELDPLISISSGNSVEVLGQGAEFTAKIQANVAFETEIKDSWISEVEVPATKSVVETTVKTFKAEANLTGADRTGYIRFFKDNIESVLTVRQAKFEPSVAVTYKGVNTIAGIGETRNFKIVSNVPFTVSAPSWIKMPVTDVSVAGTYPVDIVFEANSGAARTGQVVFRNDEYNYTYKFDIVQAEAGVCFFDDFGWLQPILDAYNAATGKKIGDTIGKKKDDNAVNIYGSALKPFVPDALAAAGYEDMNPSLELIYLQDKYLKFSKTGGNNTSLRLPGLPLTSATDVTIEFDHASMVQASGKVDDANVVVVIEGDGQFENGTKYSDVLKIDQPKGTYCWTHSSARIKGATASTRLVVVMYRVLVKDDSGNYTGSYNYKVSGAGRIFIDNINIHK